MEKICRVVKSVEKENDNVREEEASQSSNLQLTALKSLLWNQQSNDQFLH